MPRSPYHRPTHVTAWILVCATFPLIWVGGLVTTYEAGMAVPDWPNTYGYNLLLYPPARWLKVWDLCLEHGHRLIGSTVGLITMVLAVMLWRHDGRRWMKGLGLVALAGVTFQGVLGGLRVIGHEALLALAHGCTAPVFFALCAALVTFTSRPWCEERPAQNHSAAGLLRQATLLLGGGFYLQVVLGALIRHRLVSGGSTWFPVWVWLHLIVAGLVVAGTIWLLIYVPRHTSDESTLPRRARLLAVLLLTQVLLGAGAWVTNFGFPAWFQDGIWTFAYTVVQEGRLQVWTTTAHVAFGSLNVIAALSLALWTQRLLAGGRS